LQGFSPFLWPRKKMSATAYNVPFWKFRGSKFEEERTRKPEIGQFREQQSTREFENLSFEHASRLSTRVAKAKFQQSIFPPLFPYYTGV
jgi:hypothetical protein